MIEFLREWAWIASFGILLVSSIGVGINYRRTGHFLPKKWKKTKSTQTLTADIVGRDEIIKDLYDHFYDTPSPIALTGIGGIGKTVLAEAFAKSQLAHSIFYDSILLPLGSESEMAKKLERIGSKLDVPTSKNAAAYLGLVFDAMKASRKRYLLIFDNADLKEERKLALQYIPASDKISVLITSQYTDWRPPIKMVPIGPLSKDKAVELLAKESSLPADAALKNLAVKTLECLPLPITIVGADLRTPGISLDGYEKRFKKRLQEIPDTRYKKSIYAAVEMAFERLTDGAKALIQIAAFMDPDDISDEYFLRGVAGIKAKGYDPLPEPLGTVCKNGDDIKTALRKCAAHSLLAPAKWRDFDTYRIHRTTQMVLRDMMADKVGEIAGFAARLGRAQLSGDPQFDTQNWPYYHRLAPHAEVSLTFAESVEGDDGKHMAYLINSMSIFLEAATGDLDRVMRLGEGVLRISKRLYGPTSSDYATALSNIAGTKGELALVLTEVAQEVMEGEAETAFKEAITIESKITGSELRLAHKHNQLGRFYWGQKRFSDAETQWKTALNQLQGYGADAHLIASSLGNLGALYCDWARTEGDPSKIKKYRGKALGFKLRGLAKTRGALGEIHQETARGANNLSVEYDDIAESDKGLYFAIRAAAILSLMVCRGEISPDHPLIAQLEKSLEITLSALGRSPAEAPALIEAAKPEIIAQHEKWKAAKAAGEDYDPPPIILPELPA